MGLINKYINQTRKPEGLLGTMMIKGMNIGHAKLADWGLAHMKSAKPVDVIDLGCGGGIGNIIDRIHYGFVVDLFDFGWFPVFNVADICICVGCGLMFLYVILSIKEPA